MTRHVGTYERVGVMISADIARRLDNACWRETVTRGEFVAEAIRSAVIRSEIDRNKPEGINP